MLRALATSEHIAVPAGACVIHARRRHQPVRGRSVHTAFGRGRSGSSGLRPSNPMRVASGFISNRYLKNT